MSVPHGLQHMERAIHGITDYAKQRAHWSFTRVQETYGTSLEWLRYWHGDGAFAAIYTPEDARLAQKIGIPIVNLATHLPELQTPSITMDHYAIGELAAQHLLERNFRRFGYYGPSDLLFAQLRRDGYCNAVRRAGGDVKVLEVQAVDHGAGHHVDDQEQHIDQWLRQLEPPVGILASSDLREHGAGSLPTTAAARADRCFGDGRG